MKCYVIFLSIISVLISFGAQAQSNWAEQYEQAEKYVDENRYDAALQILLPLTKEQNGNDYALYSQYLYSYIMLQQNKLVSAKDMLLQLQQHSDWKELDKVNWMLATVYLKQGEYRKSVQHINIVPISYPNVLQWKKEFYPQISPIDTLSNIQKNVPYDLDLAEELYRRLSQSQNLNSVQKERKIILEKEYGFSSQVKSMISVMKERYHIAAMFPFLLKDVNVSSTNRSNQYIYDMYAGISIAIDTLNKVKNKSSFQLHAYDTEKDISKISEIVKSKEWAMIDLVLGPVFPEQYVFLKDLPELQNKIIVNPTSLSVKYADRQGAYLYKASVESIISNLVTYAATNFVLRKNVSKDPGLVEKKGVVVLYGKDVKDSVMAYLYRDSIIAKGFKLKLFLKVDLDYMGKIRSIANDSLGLISISHFATFSNDPIFAANFISVLEGTLQDIPMYVYSDWLTNSQLSYVQMENRNVHFIHPEFMRISSDTYKRFYKAYLSKYKVYPSVYALQGYEMMLLYGKALREGGTDVSVYFNKTKFNSLGLLGGYDYSNVNYNKFVPITAFKDLKLKIVNEPKIENGKVK